MNKLKMIYNKTGKKHLGVLVLIQSILILLLLVTLNQETTPNFSTRAAENTFSDGITQDAKACLSLDPEERPACAKAAGVKIAQQTQDAKERLKECLKFQPYYVHDCQLGLQTELEI